MVNGSFHSRTYQGLKLKVMSSDDHWSQIFGWEYSDEFRVTEIYSNSGYFVSNKIVFLPR